MPKASVSPLSQVGRRPCSLPLPDADLSLGNANWTKGLQAMSDWIWSGNLNPVAFPNNLGRYFLQIPGIFEQQLNFSTTLIFDEPSFRNGIQMSGFVDRVCRELVISYIAQKRHCWYSMTHHAVLGYLTAKKHGLSDAEYSAKWSNLTEFRDTRNVYSQLETTILEFADAFTSDPKRYTNDQYVRLRTLLANENERSYGADGKWVQQLGAARAARALALAQGKSEEEVGKAAAIAAAAVGNAMPTEINERKVDSQVVELAFLCLQFVALAGVFSALNIPDEDFLAGVMQGALPDAVIARVNDLCAKGGDGLAQLVPDPVNPPVAEIIAGTFSVAPAALKGNPRRVPLDSYELKMDKDLDKGLTVGGVQVGVYGWSFGFHFPGSLVYCLMLHPELARYEAPYSLPLLFNEDEWRNGTQTAGFVTRLLKELVYQKVYKTTRSRYGLEHHTMFLFNSYLDLYGVGRPPRPTMTDGEQEEARRLALEHAELACIHVLHHENAPAGVFSELERATLSWVQLFLAQPHEAYCAEERLRAELDKENQREIAAGTRRLDTNPSIGEAAARERLVDHQIAELAMLTGHMDGLGRALTILELESEDAVQVIKGTLDAGTGGIKPETNAAGEAIVTGYFNNRPSLFQFMSQIVGVTPKAFTMNELLANPKLNQHVWDRLKSGEKDFHITSSEAEKSGEF
jgi:hypothetical protein